MGAGLAQPPVRAPSRVHVLSTAVRLLGASVVLALYDLCVVAATRPARLPLAAEPLVVALDVVLLGALLSVVVGSARVLHDLAPGWRGQLLARLPALVMLALVARTDFQPHALSTPFLLGAAAVIIADGLRHARPGGPGSRLHAVQGLVHRSGPWVALGAVVALDHWDQVVFRFAGLHIAGYHRALCLLVVTLVGVLALRIRPKLGADRGARAVPVVGLLVLGLVAAIPGTTRNTLASSLRLGEAVAVLASPALAGGDAALQRHLSPGSPSLAELVPLRPVPAGGHLDWNLLVLVVDTLRADHLPCEGGAFPEAWRARFSCFERAYSPANSTHYAIPALVEGRHVEPDGPFSFVKQGVRGSGRDVGSAAYLANLDHTIDHRAMDGAASGHWHAWPAVNARVRSELGRLQQPFYLFVHHFDLHLPAFWPPRWFDVGGRAARTRYGEQVRGWTAGFADLLSALDEAGLWSNTVVVVTSDHGEDLYEDGYYAHGYTDSEGVLRVPLFVAVPGQTGRTVRHAVSTLDVAPTLAELGGLEGRTFEGRSLVPLLNGETPPARWLFARAVASSKLVAWRGPWKYSIDRERGTHALTDVVAHPTGVADRSAELPEVAHEMRQALSAFATEHATTHPHAAVARTIARYKQRLRGR